MIQRIHHAFQGGDLQGLLAAVEDPAVRARFAQQGAEAIYMPLERSKKFLGDEIVKYHDIITKAGIAQID